MISDKPECIRDVIFRMNEISIYLDFPSSNTYAQQIIKSNTTETKQASLSAVYTPLTSAAKLICLN